MLFVCVCVCVTAVARRERERGRTGRRRSEAADPRSRLRRQSRCVAASGSQRPGQPVQGAERGLGDTCKRAALGGKTRAGGEGQEARRGHVLHRPTSAGSPSALLFPSHAPSSLAFSLLPSRSSVLRCTDSPEAAAERSGGEGDGDTWVAASLSLHNNSNGRSRG